MYRVYCDGQTVYNDRLENMKIFSASLQLEVNKTGSFIFSIYPDHPNYNLIKKLKSIITVYQEDFLLFRGRVLNEEIGYYNEKTVTCEGELAFLLDSIQRPYNFTGSIAEYIALLLNSHNVQVEAENRFSLGNITVTDPNDYIVRSNIDYVDTWTEINDKLLKLLGGYISVRHEAGSIYLDYLQDFTLLSPQKIAFGKNLLDMKRIRKGEDIATVLIPLGAKLKDEEGKDTDVRLTIAAVNGDIDFIVDQEARAQYGLICKTQIWDDVTDAANLLTKGKAHLAELVKQPDTVELDAADLATVDTAFSSFHLGTYVTVSSPAHGIGQNFLVSKLNINLLNPAVNKLTLGGVISGFARAVAGVSSAQGEIMQAVVNAEKTASEAIYNVEQNFSSSIELSEKNILQTVSDKYYLKDETDTLISEVTSTLEHTASGFEMQFTSFNADLSDLANGTDAEFELIKKYIRFVDGSILLGQVGNELELKISNNRISFLQGGSEVAYFSNAKLYVTDGEYTNSLQLGKFAFIPRDNGNLSFKKVVD